MTIDPATPSTLYVGTMGGCSKARTALGAGVPRTPACPVPLDLRSTRSRPSRSTQRPVTERSKYGRRRELECPNTGLTDVSVYERRSTRRAHTLYAGDRRWRFQKHETGRELDPPAPTSRVQPHRNLAIDRRATTLYAGADLYACQEHEPAAEMERGQYRPDRLPSRSLRSTGYAIHPLCRTWMACSKARMAAGNGALPDRPYPIPMSPPGDRPAAPATLYAGTFSGVFKSTNSGGNWMRPITGLKAAIVYAW